MPPVRTKSFPNEIIKSIARNNDAISDIGNDKILHHINRRQEDIFKNTNDSKVTPTSVSSIPTITISAGPISVTLITTFTNTPTIDTNNSDDGSPTDISATDINATPTDISATDINATPTPSVPVVPGTGTIPEVSPSIPPTITTPLNSNTLTAATSTPTQNPLSSSSMSPSTTSSSLPTTSTLSPNALSNNINAWMLPILVISILIIVLTFLGLIYRNRKRKRNTLQNINAGDITDKDKENGSKSNSLTSSINSISSSFKIKKGKIVPGDINVDSPPAPIVTNNKDDGEKPQMPVLKRTPTTVSAFQELVDLTDDEHINLRNSTNSGIYTIASRLSSTPTYVNYDAEEGSSNNAINVIPLHQERIDTIIPYSDENGGVSGNDTSNNYNQ